MKKLQGLIFDLDGTLVDSAADLRQALNQVLLADNRRPLTLEETKQFIGDGPFELIRRSFAATGDPPPEDKFGDCLQTFLHTYSTMKPDPAQIYPGVVDILRHYREAGVALGLCTNKPEKETFNLLKKLHLLNFFGYIAGGDTFTRRKPHPDHLTNVITALDVPLTGCVMVGDSNNDVMAAKGARVPVIILHYGYDKDVARLPADAFIDRMADLPMAIQKLGFTI